MKRNILFKIIISASIVLVVITCFLYRTNNWPGGVSAWACLISLLMLGPVLIFLAWKNNKWLNGLQKQSSIAGLCFGLLWTAEISMNNFLHPGVPLRDWLDDIFWGVIAALILGLAIRASYRAVAGKIWAGTQAGFWSGLASGAVACITALLMDVFGMHLIVTDPLVMQEWADVKAAGYKAVGYTQDMTVYFAYQTLAGAIMHLVILGGIMGLLLGLAGGVLCQLPGQLRRK